MANDITFDILMKGFGVVTVMNACIFELKDGYSYTSARNCYNIVGENGVYGEESIGLKPNAWKAAGEYIDTLKIANFTQEGPTKTVTGGQYANPLIKYGKTMTCEMQDALGRASTLKRFFGCDYVEGSGRLSITDRFPGPFAIEGDTFFIDQKTGKKRHVFIFIPQFIPDAILTLTQDAEGDATVFDLNGTVSVTDVCDADGSNARSIFYEIRDTSFFGNRESDLEDEAPVVGKYRVNQLTAIDNKTFSLQVPVADGELDLNNPFSGTYANLFGAVQDSISPEQASQVKLEKDDEASTVDSIVYKLTWYKELVDVQKDDTSEYQGGYGTLDLELNKLNKN